jgi:broad specificity phosphatase PhoE
MDQHYTTFYIVRHGQTHANVGQIMDGHLNSALTATGKLQAKALSESLKHIHFDVVFSSDLARAHLTAEIITLERQLAINTTNILRERSVGRFEGQSYQAFEEANKEIFERIETMADEEIRKLKYDHDIESDDELITRLLVFLREVAVSYAGKNVLVVSHGGILRALLIHFGWATYKELPMENINNTSYFKLRSDGIEFFIGETYGIEKETTTSLL